MVRRIAFYYTHYQCLGHTSRIYSIINSLSRRARDKLEIYLIQASLPQPEIKFPANVKKINLPFPFYTRNNFRHPFKLDFKEVNCRAKVLSEKIKSIDPDIFITEYFPFGHKESEYELLPVLNYLKSRNKQVICSLGYPFFSLKNLSHTQAILHFYDKILLHNPPELEIKCALDYLNDKSKQDIYKSFIDKIKRKIIFTGYVLPCGVNQNSLDRISREFSKGRKTILVTRGGGAYYPKIIVSSLLAARLLKEYDFLVVAGPSTSASEWEGFIRLKNRYKLKNVVLKKYIKDFPQHLRNANLVLSTAAYNSSVMLMYYRKKAVIVPFQGYSGYQVFWEQPARARLLGKSLGSSIIEYDQLNRDSLAHAISAQLEKKSGTPAINKNWFNGGIKSAQEILSS